MQEPTESSNTTASGICGLIGLWIIISPFELSFGHLHLALWNNVAVGIVVAVLAIISVSRGYNQTRWSWGNALLGFWLIISPFVLGFATHSTARWNNIIVGAIVGVLAWSSATGVHSRQAISSEGN